MIAWIIALIAGCAAFAAASCVADIGYGWSAFLAVVAFGACQIIVGLFVRKRVTAEMNKVQAILADGQKRLVERGNGVRHGRRPLQGLTSRFASKGNCPVA